MQYTQVYRSGTTQALGALTVALCVAGLATLAVRGGDRDLLRYAGPLLAVAWVGWFGYWRPRVVMDDEAVTLHNVVRTVRVPWSAVVEIHSRYGLRLDTPDASYGAWAVAAPAGRERLRGGDTEASLMARRRLERVRGLGMLPAGTPPGDTEESWSVPAVATGLAVVTMAVAGLLLSF